MKCQQNLAVRSKNFDRAITETHFAAISLSISLYTPIHATP